MVRVKKKSKLSAAKRNANAKWDAEHIRRFTVAFHLDLFDEMHRYLDVSGESRNSFVNAAVTDMLARRTQDEYETIPVKVRRDGHWYRALALAAERREMTIYEYARRALQRALEEDGYMMRTLRGGKEENNESALQD